ncbi:unnamed protein product [Sympodiomycopsis kandeliae]
MGIPKFFRSMSERYPLISQLVEVNKVPEIDRLYLDMNGIIHNCSHPNDGDVHFRMTETEIFLAVFSYIEHIFLKIRPKELFFLAVDGVAPRAKMNQQRSRRFRTAKEARDLKNKALQRGEELPEEEAFDSNCITPGTPFMARLSEQLKWFIAKKVTEDAAWQGPEIILSGHDVPGEGEHKVMEYIRLAKAQPGYNPNVRHCLYGLDADLIMLGLLSHDPHFALLREEVSFGPKKKKSGGLENQNFFLLHLSLFREYLDLEFSDLKSTLPFEYSLERVIDDFILLNIFVGNDFLPHLPGLHINEGALPLLFNIYKKILPVAGGYLNEGGNLRTDRLQLVLTELTAFERQQFEEEYADTFMRLHQQKKATKATNKSRTRNKVMMSAKQKTVYDTIKNFVQELRVNPHSASRDLFLSQDTSEDDKSFINELCRQLGLGLTLDEYDPVEDCPAIAISSSIGLYDDDEVAAAESEAAIARVLKKYDGAKVHAEQEITNTSTNEEDEGDLEEAEYQRALDAKMLQWKREYYKDKLEFDFDDKEALSKLAFRYVEGLQWVLKYYYEGVASWGWFYDYHYAPKISDLLDVASMSFNFDLGKPFRPFDQLMGVLPALSASHIPPAFRELMTDPSSPIIDFYPNNFEADLNGKKQDWEAVVKIPFIEEKRLLAALDQRIPLLTAEEKARNLFGVSWLCKYDPDQEHFYPSSLPGVFPDIVHSRAKVQTYHLPTLQGGLELIKGLPEGVGLGSDAMAGFPSLKNLSHYARLGYHGVSVFQGESKNESVVINIDNKYEDVSVKDIAESMVGKRTFVAWPFLQEGLVIAVSDSLFRYEMGLVGNAKKVIQNPHSSEAQSSWRRKAAKIEHHYSKRFAVIIGDVEIILHVRPLKGLRRLIDGSFVKEYEEDADKEIEQAVQLCVPQVSNEDNRYLERAALPLHKEFPEKTKVFFLGEHAYGSPAAVVGSSTDMLAIELAFFINQAKENAALHQLVVQRTREQYYPSFVVAKKVGLSGLALSKMTSSMMVDMPEGSRLNVGLNLKFEAKSQKVLGYSRKGTNGWEFSDKAIQLINEYKDKFPEIPQRFMAFPNEDTRSMEQFFGSHSVKERSAQMKQWIKEKGVRDLEAVPLFAEQLGSDAIATIESFTDRLSQVRASTQGGMVKRAIIKGIPRTALLKPNHAVYRLQAQRFELGDRVIAVADSGNIPMSARGVVVGLNTSNVDVVFDVAFLAGTTLGGRCSAHRGATVSFAQVLNLTQPQFTSSKAADAADTSVGMSALERTLGPIQANGHSNGTNGTRGGSNGSRGRGGYRPASSFTPAPTPKGGAPAPTQILSRNGNQTNGEGVRVDSGTRFSHVASGSQRPTADRAKRQAEQASSVNPLLAALNLNGNGSGSSNGRGGSSNGSGRGRGGSRGGRGGRGRGH